MNRPKIFIGHANPQDNEFTLWIQAKLQNEGYDVISDQNLTGGEEDYWDVLQKALENDCCKYLLVLTKNSFAPEKKKLIQEFDFACSLGTKLKIRDFVMLMKVDDVSFDVRMGLGTMNHFRFDKSWDAALKKLVRKLEIDQVPRSAPGPLSIREWLRNEHNTTLGVEHGAYERHYTNWVRIHHLGKQKFWFHEFANDTQAGAVAQAMPSLPAIRHGRFVVSFSEHLPELSGTIGFVSSSINPKRSFAVPIVAIHQYTEAGEFPTYHDLRRLYVEIMKDALEKHLIELGLNVFRMSNKVPCFFYAAGQLPKDKVPFWYEGKPTYRQLVGDYYEAKWHYGVSFNVRLNPFPSFSFKGRLLFSNDGKEIWADDGARQKARKSKGKSFFNEHWRMLLLAFLRSIADNDSIRIPLNAGQTLALPWTPEVFLSTVGYNDPSSDARLIPIDDYDEEEDRDETEETEKKEGSEATVA
jgi:hypothetical protein